MLIGTAMNLEIQGNPDVLFAVFNTAIVLLGSVSLFGVWKCNELSNGRKWLYMFASVILFGLSWMAFILTAVSIAFSGGFHGE